MAKAKAEHPSTTSVRECGCRRLTVELMPPPFRRLRYGPNDTETVPPIPHDLRNQECLYGYFITDELMEAYWLANPQARPGKLVAIPNEYSVLRVARQLGLDIWIDEKRSTVESIAWFSYTEGGKIQNDRVPAAVRRESFERALGITEKAQWLGTGIHLMLVCVRITHNHLSHCLIHR